MINATPATVNDTFAADFESLFHTDKAMAKVFGKLIFADLTEANKKLYKHVFPPVSAAVNASKNAGVDAPLNYTDYSEYAG